MFEILTQIFDISTKMQPYNVRDFYVYVQLVNDNGGDTQICYTIFFIVNAFFSGLLTPFTSKNHNHHTNIQKYSIFYQKSQKLHPIYNIISTTKCQKEKQKMTESLKTHYDID